MQPLSKPWLRFPLAAPPPVELTAGWRCTMPAAFIEIDNDPNALTDPVRCCRRLVVAWISRILRMRLLCGDQLKAVEVGNGSIPGAAKRRGSGRKAA